MSQQLTKLEGYAARAVQYAEYKLTMSYARVGLYTLLALAQTCQLAGKSLANKKKQQV